MTTILFAPRVVAEMIGLDPEVQRDMRRNGLLDGYGETTPGGHWRYSIRDVIGIWIAERLRISSVPLKSLLLRSHMAAGELIKLVRGEAAKRYHVILDTGLDEVKVGGSESIFLNSLADLEGRQFERADILDLATLAEALPDSIREKI